MPTSKPQARHTANAGKLRACPQCGYDAIWVDQTFVVEFNGKLVGGRMMGFCNTTACDQRYWFYPLTGRITRRNTGRFSAYYRRPAMAKPEPHLPSVEEIFGRPPLHKRIWAWYKAHVWYHVKRFGYRIQGLPV